MSLSSVPLGDIADFVNGVAFKPADWEESGKRILRIQNLTDPTKPCNRTNRAVARKYEVSPGDILVSWSATLGVFVWEGPDTALVNQHIFRVVPDLERIDSNYLRHMLADALVEMQRHLHGATMKHVNRREFLATTIPLPPLAEQKRIAGILDAADALRAKRQEALAQLDTLRQSTFLDMFGDPVTNPMGWDRKPLTEALELINGRAFKSSEWSGNGLPIIRIQNVKRPTELFNRFEGTYDAKHLVREGDILLCWAGQLVSIGVHRWDREDGLLNQHIFKVIPRFDCEPSFVTYMLGFVIEQAKSSFRGIEMKHLTKADLARQQITIPPIDLQYHFATIVESAGQQKVRQRAHLAELDMLFASLQSHAFRGDL